MPIGDAVARRQIKRFAGFPQFPENAESLRELVKAFVAVSQSADHAEAIGDELMRAMKFCPKPAEVFEASERLLERKRTEPEEWSPVRRPGDEPFGGIADLVDERLLAILRRKAEHGLTRDERESALRFLREWEARQPVTAGGAQR